MFKIKLLPIALVFCLLFPVIAAWSQEENVWAFGYRAGIDFNTTSPTAIVTGMRILEGSASVCDEKGALLFYTDGTYIWDKSHDTMPNGHNINPIKPFMLSGEYVPSTFSTTQAVAIVPRPRQDGQYYVFSLTAWDNWENGGKLYYSLVDMTLRNGLGDVVSGTKGVFLDSLLTERMSPAGGLSCNAWLTVLGQDRKFKSFEITAAGVDPVPSVSALAGGDTGMSNGCLVFSPDYRMLAVVQSVNTNYNALYSFDPANGRVSNPVLLFPENTRKAYGACFSPDNSRLYINADNDSIYQFNLKAGSAREIMASKRGVTSYKAISGMKRGPDGKIYLVGDRSAFSPSLSAIPYPNLAAPDCGFEPDVLKLVQGTYGIIGLPNDVPGQNRPVKTSQTLKLPCYQSDSFHMAALDTQGREYQWNTGAIQSAMHTRIPGTYWVTYYTGSCTYHVDTFHLVSFLPEDVLPGIKVRPACGKQANGSLLLTRPPANGLQYAFSWLDKHMDSIGAGDSINNLLPGLYHLRVRIGPACDTLIVIYLPEENYRVGIEADTLVCEGSNVVFRNSSDRHFETWQWRFGDGDSSHLQNPDHKYLSPGLYQVMLVGLGPVCNDTAYASVLVDPVARQLSFLADREAICTGEALTFTPLWDKPFSLLHWDFGDGRGLDEVADGRVQHAYDEAGTFEVQLIASFRVCPAKEFRDTLVVHPLPHVNLGPDTALCLQNKPLLLQNYLAKEANDRYLWSTGATSAGIMVRNAGEYYLQVTSASGCISREYITVHKDCYIDLPNAFTPNGDGANDYFFPRMLTPLQPLAFHMRIFNRWGHMLFETTGREGEGWDGRFNGQPQPPGAYVYWIEVCFGEGHKEQYKGNFTLLR